MINSAIEKARNEKTIGSTLEAKVLIQTNNKNVLNILNNVNMQDICIVSEIKEQNVEDPIAKGYLSSFENNEEETKVFIYKTTFNKCLRCWQYKEEVKDSNSLCKRCSESVMSIQ